MKTENTVVAVKWWLRENQFTVFSETIDGQIHRLKATQVYGEEPFEIAIEVSEGNIGCEVTHLVGLLHDSAPALKLVNNINSWKGFQKIIVDEDHGRLAGRSQLALGDTVSSQVGAKFEAHLMDLIGKMLFVIEQVKGELPKEPGKVS